MTREEEAAAIEACVHGNPDAFQPLVEIYHARLCRLIYKMTGRQDMAEEIVQEAFVRAYTKLGSFQGRSSFLTWVTRIAMNACRDHLCKERRFVEEGEEILTTIAAEETADAFDQQADCAIVQQIINCLPLKYREVMVLRYIEELSLDEIAEALGIGLSAAKMRLSRGLAMVRAALERRSMI